MSTINYRNTASVDGMKLISEVRKYEHIYNRSSPGYTDVHLRDSAWDKINAVLFPCYTDQNKKIRKIISKTVRKRWKSLRYSVIKEMKRKIDNPDYERTLPNPILDELGFLIPFVRPHFLDSNSQVANNNDCSRSQSPVSAYEQKMIRIDSPLSISDVTASPSQSLAEPEIHMHTYNNYESCIKVDFADETYISNDDQLFKQQQLQQQQQQQQNIHQHNEEYRREEQSTLLPPSHKKQKRLSSKDFQLEIVKILSDCERREEEARDSDRLFLLSLLPDLKEIPAHKKILVKAQILSAVAQGWST